MEWPINKPIYDINKSWEDNLENGPFVEGYKYQERRDNLDESKFIDFLGAKLASPLGVPAGPLLNSQWVKFALESGFDLPTYKTIRSHHHLGHPVPNVKYLDLDGEDSKQFTKSDSGRTIHATSNVPSTMDQLAITNSFGMPSMSKEYLYKDIGLAHSYLGKGQSMIVSITGTASTAHDFLQDFIDTVRIAVDAGSKIVEVNYSCPNVVTGEGQIYHNPDAVYEISSTLVKELAPKNIPLIIKVGVMEDLDKMAKLFQQAENAGVAAIAGINTLSMKVTDKVSGEPSLGESRLTSGVCGAPIRSAALDWVSTASSIIKKQNNNLKLLGCGGIVKPEHFDQFLDAGADIAMSATGLMWDPYIAMKWHNKN
ncbi:dihydroorotate oxidase [Dictyostelium purpureum]|uniref:Dihydroorotate oxidase n=1 Tax=Dictyostelium purpureum TaxID=5786 RepID=F0ZGH4_DICPU|nr:dihydroorotate oxidase [Dictyostelium purpureum]EGC36944.1 dihydroorotate oxidase [Dictyostelium purpureum]|eukprot:XP_003286512.1 dihydroorotate oxidase [Dictyostelium purpureum]